MPPVLTLEYLVPQATIWLCAVLAGTLLGASLCAVIARKPTDRLERMARACRTLGILFFGSSVVGSVAKLIVFAEMVERPWPKDIVESFSSNTLIDVGFNLVFGVFLAASPLALSLIAAERAKRSQF